ncbi:hypothetical protein LEP1GSC017_1482 [Leptospira meyeri serovar Hardjo str. Went 5]|nr:hypothetical protein LEP1GSC017_1482 [Leptospira meyeri serovar Hardjo str. Went 5]
MRIPFPLWEGSTDSQTSLGKFIKIYYFKAYVTKITLYQSLYD